MPLYHIVILALVQGISEFLPVSSSGHLTLVHHFLGEGTEDWTRTQILDVAVHIGTLLAALLYFRQEVKSMVLGLFAALRGDFVHPGFRLGLLLVAGSAPVMVAGVLLNMWQPDWLRSVEVVAAMLILFGIVLGLADRYSPMDRAMDSLSWKDSVLIGLGQMLALIPGVSRAGITMTVGRLTGLKREEAARFSLLLGIVAISAAGILNGYEFFKTGQFDLIHEILIGIGVSFFSAIVAIIVLMRWLRIASFTPFVVYRILLGAGLLVWLYI